jgi:hypothetical protein
MARHHTVIGTFASAARAQLVRERLLARGFMDGEVMMMWADRGGGRHFVVDATPKVPEGAALGSMVGGLTSAIAVGILVGLGASVAGWELGSVDSVLAVLAGIGAGGILGWMIGAVVGLGFSHHRARIVDEDHLSGHVVIGVHTPNDAKARFAERAFEDEGATSVAA